MQVSEDEVAAIMPYCVAIAVNKWERLKYKLPIDDLISEVMLGVTRAALKYNPSRGRFEPFAVTHAKWALGEYLRTHLGFRQGEVRRSKMRAPDLVSFPPEKPRDEEDGEDGLRKLIAKSASYHPTVEQEIFLKERLARLPDHYREMMELRIFGYDRITICKMTHRSDTTFVKALAATRKVLSK